MERSFKSLFSLGGKVAIVTGASRGIGKEIALAYGNAGAKVVAAARNVEFLKQVVEEIKEKGGDGMLAKCDVSRDEDIFRLIKTTVESFGTIDILVNNAGISPYVVKSEEVTRGMWEEMFQVNLFAPFLLCREAGKVMIKQKKGRIINMASVGGLIGMPRQIIYSSTKGALIQMTRTLAVEWAAHKITVNAIAPSYLATDLTEGVRKSKMADLLLQRVPMGYFGAAGDVAGGALYLASEAGRYVTGTILVVDGGMLAC